MRKRLPNPIAIDGPAASGKSSVGRALAERFGYKFLDTGLMYRAFAFAALREGVPPDDEACAEFADRIGMRLGDELEARVFIGNEDVTDLLHTPEIEQNVSSYARLPAVRAAMRAAQRAYSKRGRTILAGRDIGEVVLPDAPLKFYLEADEAARARRRNAQRGIMDEAVARDTHSALSRRDRLDSPQTYIAPGAFLIDTTEIPLEDVVRIALEKVACAND
jgi:cytidylate kinase